MPATATKTLWTALLAFRAEAPALPKDKVNPHFKNRYTSLDAIADTIDPLLVKHGLVWTATPSHDDAGATLDYQLAHAETGEALSGSMRLLLDRENSQGLGSALTYARRYAKVAVLDLVADEDDDGNAASRPRTEPAPPFGPRYDKDGMGGLVGAACTQLAGDRDLGVALFKAVVGDCEGYMPMAAALAILRCAEQLNRVPDIEAPDPQ